MTHQLEDFAQKDGQGSERPKPGLWHPLTLDVRDGVEPPRGWLALALLCAAQFMVVLDFSIVNVALPSMQKSLGFSPTTLQWVVSAYSLLFGGFLLLGGRAADLFGRRRVFLLGLVLFTLASLGGGFAQSPLELIVARASQGLAAFSGWCFSAWARCVVASPARRLSRLSPVPVTGCVPPPSRGTACPSSRRPCRRGQDAIAPWGPSGRSHRLASPQASFWAGS